MTALLFLAPFLRKVQGQQDILPRTIRLRADFNWLKPDTRREFLRAQRRREGVTLFAHQGSAVLSSLVWADGLIDNPGGQVIRAGDMVDFLPFDAWGLI